jgi:hypothetical protein
MRSAAGGTYCPVPTVQNRIKKTILIGKEICLHRKSPKEN